MSRCSAAARSGDLILLALAAAVPLAFNPLGTLQFEPFKATLVRLAAVLLVVAAVAPEQPTRRQLSAWRRLGDRRGVITASLGLLLATALGTAVSIDPLTSVVGRYDRFGGLLTAAAWLVVLVALSQSRCRAEGLVDWLLWWSLPVCLYALIQQARLDPLPWLDRLFGPASTLGSPTVLGGYLAMLAPLTVARLYGVVRARCETLAAGLTVLLGLQIAALLATGVRGALLALLGGLLAWAGLIAWRGHRAGPGLAIAVVAAAGSALFLLNMPGAPFDALRDRNPVLGRLGSIRPSDASAAERLLVWQAAAETMRWSGPRILVGFGPDTQALAIESAQSPELTAALADLRYDRAHNLAVDQLLTTGLLGLAAGAGLAGTALWAGLRAVQGAERPELAAALVAALVAHVVDTSFAFATPATTLVAAMALGLLARGPDGWRAASDEAAAGWLRPGWEPKEAWPGPARCLMVAVLIGVAALVGLALASPLAADAAYRRGVAYGAGKDTTGQRVWLERAALLAPYRDLYWLALGVAETEQARTARSPERRGQALGLAEAALHRAVGLAPLDPYGRYHLAQLHALRAEAEANEAERELAIGEIEAAIEQGPARVLFRDTAVELLLAAGQPKEALEQLGVATRLDRQSAERLALQGDALRALGRSAEAEAAYREATRTSASAAAAHAGLAALRLERGELEAALEAARLAVKHRLTDWRYREQLGRLEARAGDRDEAVQQARAAARFAPPWEQPRLRAWVEELKAGG
jgi:O-antigen ligase/Flp pilus assembly protein TadD